MSWESLLKCWESCIELHDIPEGVSPDEIEEFEMRVGWLLPEAVRRLYSYSNGLSLFQGNLNFYPLSGNELSLENASTVHRQSNWPIPENVWIFGNNGQGDKFGFWLDDKLRILDPIIEIGQIFSGNGNMAVVGSTLPTFLLARSSYYCLLCEAPAQSLDFIELPDALRTADPDDDTWLAIGFWADPTRPGNSDDPYLARLDARAIERIVSRVA